MSDNKQPYIIIVLEHGASTADNISLDMDNDTHREELSEAFDTTMGTWSALDIDEAHALAASILKAIKAQSLDIDDLNLK